jgi:toxin HigB-1
MIRTFRHKGLAELWETGHTGRIDRRLHKRILVRLDVLDKALRLEDLKYARPRLPPAPGFRSASLHRPCQRPMVRGNSNGTRATP